MTYRLSPSSLNLFRECPRCFWLAMVKNVRRPSGPMSSIPIKMDSIIKSYYNRHRGLELPPTLKGQVEGRLAVGMPLTLHYEAVKDNVVVWGRPDDYIELEDASIAVLDNKTASKAPLGVHPSYQLQMDVYSYLLRMNGYKIADKAFLGYYSPIDSELHHGMGICCTVVEVATNPNRVKDLVHEAFGVLSETMPEPGEKCPYCTWSGELHKMVLSRSFTREENTE